jgi:hypothetical protein
MRIDPVGSRGSRLAILSLYLYFVSTLVLRVRGSSEIADNPLDLAGIFRIGTMSAAALVSLLLWLTLHTSL